ncbi:uncharacterized protein LOC115622488, partial [Scaptodrosophila lebanonensis]|uniref:Uncharacterized protein LOC115622488 n=1 Tax=Drosophila lebanonensis TaxID=7225 RepID=A0A6J2T8H1_DROLE
IESCEPGEVCSDGHWCRPEGEAEAGCDRTETVPTCPQCSDSVTFVCTSRTTFQKCNGIDIDEQVYNCPANKVCDMASGKFCIDMCGQVGALECNIPAPTT